MKQCSECHKWADNGAERCQNCGAPFEYDPKVNPFSETRILLGILIVVVFAIIISGKRPLKLPDPTECSTTSYRRFRRIVDTYYQETRNVLKSEILGTREMSELMRYKNDAKSIPVPACLEPAKAEFVEYLEEVYFIGMYSGRGAYQAATISTQKAGGYWESLNQELDAIEECVPNCQ
jgi:hypothetical protein